MLQSKRDRPTESDRRQQAEGKLMVQAVTGEQQAEVLSFLSRRPLNTFGMTGFIRRNGITSPLNRGTFYACRDLDGHLQGVALIGHFTLFDAADKATTRSFARLAQEKAGVRLIMGEQKSLSEFWRHYGGKLDQRASHISYSLLEQRESDESNYNIPLRPARMSDLDLVVAAHAEAIKEQSGTDPLETEPDAFRKRCAERIERRQTWVWVAGGKLMFKAELMTDSPEVAYIEGVWVAPSERGKGNGKRCLSQLSQRLIKRHAPVCLLLVDRESKAKEFYLKAGYKPIGQYGCIRL